MVWPGVCETTGEATCASARIDGACQKMCVPYCFGPGVCVTTQARQDACRTESLLHGAQDINACHLAAG